MTDNEDRRDRKKSAKLSVQAGRVSRAVHRVSERFDMFPPFLIGTLPNHSDK